jgi:hypothetical protein
VKSFGLRLTCWRMIATIKAPRLRENKIINFYGYNHFTEKSHLSKARTHVPPVRERRPSFRDPSRPESSEPFWSGESPQTLRTHLSEGSSAEIIWKESARGRQ